MANWFDSALKVTGEAVVGVGKNINETASDLVTTVQRWLPFSDEDTLAFLAVLLAVAAADGEIAEDELSMIMSSPEVDKLSTEGKRKLQTYSCNPPSLEESIKKLSQASQELKFGLMFYILNLVWMDGVMTSGEEKAIAIAQKELEELEINHVQVKAIEEFTRALGKARNAQSQDAVEEVKRTIERMKEVGVPIKALAHSQDGTEGNIEYSDEKFLEKMKGFGVQTGKVLVEQAFILWHTLHDPETPTGAKLIIAGALAYWILPAEA